MKLAQTNKSSTWLLMEFILCLLIFGLCSTVCIQVFAKAHVMEQDSSQQLQSVNVITSLAESMSQETDLSAYLTRSYASAMIKSEEHSYCIFYNEDWMPCAKDTGVYLLTITDNGAGEVTYEMLRQTDKQVLYTLTTSSHQGEAQ